MAKLIAGNGNVTEEIDKIHDITDVETNLSWKNCIYLMKYLSM